MSNVKDAKDPFRELVKATSCLKLKAKTRLLPFSMLVISTDGPDPTMVTYPTESKTPTGPLRTLSDRYNPSEISQLEYITQTVGH